MASASCMTPKPRRNSARTTKEITKDARAFLEHGAPEPDDADAAADAAKPPAGVAGSCLAK